MNNPSQTARLLANRAPVSAHLNSDQTSLIVTTVEVPIGTEQVVSKTTSINLADALE
jgi:hypothetical protein